MKLSKQSSNIASTVTAIVLLLSLAHSSKSHAESQYYLGIEPQFHREEWYAENELNSNILPFVYETPLRDHLGLRLRSHAYLHTGGADGLAISLTGLGGALLWYIDPKSEYGLHGFNFGPATIVSYDFLEKITHGTVAIEAGYAFPIANRWNINVALQAGRSYFSGATHSSGNHFGIFVNFGRWF